ncbi:MAG: peptidase S10 [Alphaproteobacteria bacterium]|nr:peptidase S10 [Alphaproteobacteria bacterium]
MKTVCVLMLGAMLTAAAAFADEGAPKDKDAAGSKPRTAKIEHAKPEEATSDGFVTVAGSRIDYRAVAGALIVHPRGWDDTPKITGEEPETEDRQDKNRTENASAGQNPTAEAAMFYVAYIKKSAAPEGRPLTFLFNGGPGSSTIWLHMGAFGPKRVVTADDTHSPAAPYAMVDNNQSLLDASDLVFIDAPGTGFSRIAGKDKQKAFYGVDADAYAFAEFITRFLSKYGRWNSPKYLFGESYGTTRAAVLIKQLETNRYVDFNGVILLSQILNFDLSPGSPQFNPGVNLPYQLALPTYAATAWYHHKLASNLKDLDQLLDKVEHFAMTDYALALEQGGALDPGRRGTIAARLHDFTGLPVEYIKKAELRINSGEFEKTLQDDSEITTGQLDTRFSGPTMDPLSKGADYDPQTAAIGSAYVSAFNDYARKTLKYSDNKTYRPMSSLWGIWDSQHQPPGAFRALRQSPNVLPDLAWAMKYNPGLRVLVNAGYFDLATPFYEAIYEMRQLPVPDKLRANIEFKFYQSGHMVYAHEPALKELHDNVAAFIRKTGGGPSPSASNTAPEASETSSLAPLPTTQAKGAPSGGTQGLSH